MKPLKDKISITIDNDVLTKLKEKAELDDRSLSQYINIILKQANKRVKKDKFSAFEYGLYYIKQEDAKKRKKKRFEAKDWCFLN